MPKRDNRLDELPTEHCILKGWSLADTFIPGYVWNSVTEKTRSEPRTFQFGLHQSDNHVQRRDRHEI